MAGPNDFTGQNIQDTYQRVLQISSSGQITDGTGSLVLINATTSSHALFAVSASHEITFEVSSSYAQTASMASSDFVAQGDILLDEGKAIFFDGTDSTPNTKISKNGTSMDFRVNNQQRLMLGTSETVFSNNLVRIGSTAAPKSLHVTDTISGSKDLTVATHITASGDISSSGDIIANSYSGKIVASDTNDNTAHFPLIVTSGNTVPNISNGIQFNPSTDELQVGDVFGGTGVTIGSGNVRATQNISASGKLIGNIDGGSF